MTDILTTDEVGEMDRLAQFHGTPWPEDSRAPSESYMVESNAPWKIPDVPASEPTPSEDGVCAECGVRAHPDEDTGTTAKKCEGCQYHDEIRAKSDARVAEAVRRERAICHELACCHLHSEAGRHIAAAIRARGADIGTTPPGQ